MCKMGHKICDIVKLSLAALEAKYLGTKNINIHSLTVLVYVTIITFTSGRSYVVHLENGLH